MATATTVLAPVSNDGQPIVESGCPYIAHISVEGAAPILFHRWSVEEVEAKSKAHKGSAVKKIDNIEAYVYRTDRGHLAVPTEYFRQSVIAAARFKQDPRSPRKSAQDLFKAGIAGLDEFCDLGVKDWDYLDRRRVMVQRNGITRSRPALYKGWKVQVLLQVLLPEYIDPQLLNETIQSAGRLIGVGDFRPTYGRFNVVNFNVVSG